MIKLVEKPFFFLRHGETDWNREGRYQGQHDIPLNTAGIAQATTARELLMEQNITVIHTSSLSRAFKTAEIVNTKHNVPLIPHRSLWECHYGELEGQLKNDPTVDLRWKKGDTPKGAERYLDFSTRIITLLNKVLSSEGTALIVAHRAVFWPILEAMGISTSSSLANAQPLYLEAPNVLNDNWTITEIT